MEREFDIVEIGQTEADAVEAFVEGVWAEMPEKDWFAVDKGYVREVLTSGKALAWKAMERGGDAVAAVCIVVVPGLDDENLGLQLRMETSELLRVVHMDIVAVSPCFRGCGLQQRLMQEAESVLCRRGFRHLLCTAHPENVYSCRNMEFLGYRPVWEGLKYGGLPRRIYAKML